MDSLTEHILREQDILNKLARDNRVDSSMINVEIVDHTVKLTGTVPSWFDLRKAEEDTWQVPGVNSVENLLSVKYPDRKVIPTDDVIADNIRKMLEWDSRLDAEKIQVVDVTGGKVTIGGKVSNFWEKLIAESVVLYATGVTNVENKIHVNPQIDQMDEDIKEDIEIALRRNRSIKHQDITVNVTNGIVTLSGLVHSWHEKEMVFDAAISVHGVRDVVNKLEIADLFTPAR